MTNFGCHGEDDRIEDCSKDFLDVGESECDHVSVSCLGSASEVTVRLLGGRSMGEGRVEVYYAGVWGTVCSKGWDNKDAEVVCRQLGFLDGTAAITPRFGKGAGVTWMNNIACKGTETELDSCAFSGWGESQCLYSTDAGVVCRGTLPKIVRLAGSFVPNQGRLEVYYGKVWGTVCNDGWTREDADIVCRQLGYSRSADSNLPAAYWKGSGHIWMSNVRCSGNEAHLHDCPFDGWGVTDCRHSEDVGVLCQYLQDSEVNLDICYSSKWCTLAVLSR
jgi:hypothetical protein